MSMIILVLVFCCFLVGLIGTMLPILPGIPLIFSGMVLYGWYFGMETIGISTYVILGIGVALSFLFDILGSMYGAKRYGSTKWGIWGAVAGGFLGVIMLNIIGLMAGIFLGAFLGEAIFAKRETKQSLKIGLASVGGFLGGTFLKIILGVVMIGIFLVKIW
ncbi:MAG: DUF456 domain-containing protein [Candidatus Moranbacteria bacterium]|nr:DUF456 domain-containing protein [Candidatus Moranbacteria bacterium]